MDALVIRNAEIADIPALIVIDHEAFSGDMPKNLLFTEDHFRSWIEAFQEGFLVAISDGVVVGYAAIQILNEDVDNPIPTWAEATNNGFIAKTHNPKGNTVYGISFCVSRSVGGLGVGKRLMLGIIEATKKYKDVHLGVIVSRVPGYHKVATQMTIEDYVFKTRSSGLAEDPLLAFYQRCGWRITKILPNYIEDKESHNYGVLMTYRRP